MVFNLIVEPARKVVAEHTAIAKVLSGGHLMFVKVGVRRMRTSVGQVIDLCVDHEAYAEYGTWQRCPDDCFPEWKSKVWPHVHDENVSHPTKNVCHKTWPRQG